MYNFQTSQSAHFNTNKNGGRSPQLNLQQISQQQQKFQGSNLFSQRQQREERLRSNSPVVNSSFNHPQSVQNKNNNSQIGHSFNSSTMPQQVRMITRQDIKSQEQISILENRLKVFHRELEEAKNKPPEHKIIEKIIPVQDETKIKFLESRLFQLVQELDEKGKNLNEKIIELKETQARNNEYKNLMELKNNENQQMRVYVLDLEKKKKDQDTQIMQQKNLIRQIQEDLKNRNQTIERKNREQESLSIQLTQENQLQKNQIIQKDEQIENWKLQHDKNIESIKQLAKKITIQQDEISKSDNERGRLSNLLKLNIQEVGDLRIKIEQLLQSQRTQNSQIIELESLAHQLKLEKEELKEQLQNKHSEVENKQKGQQSTILILKEKEMKLESLDEQYKQINTILQEKHTELQLKTQEMEEVVKRHGKVKLDIKYKDKEVTQLKQKNQELSDSITQKDQQIQQQQIDINDLQEEKSKLLEIQETQKKEIERLNSGITKKEKEHKISRSELEKISKDLQEQIEKQQNEITQLKNDQQSNLATFKEYEEHMVELELIENDYYVVKEQLQYKNKLCDEQENELSQWRFKYAEFTNMAERTKDLLFHSTLSFILLDSIKQQFIQLKEDKEKKSHEQIASKQVRRQSVLQKPQMSPHLLGNSPKKGDQSTFQVLDEQQEAPSPKSDK